MDFIAAVTAKKIHFWDKNRSTETGPSKRNRLKVNVFYQRSWASLIFSGNGIILHGIVTPASSPSGPRVLTPGRPPKNRVTMRAKVNLFLAERWAFLTAIVRDSPASLYKCRNSSEVRRYGLGCQPNRGQMTRKGGPRWWRTIPHQRRGGIS
jgi:hypothetical protein